MALQAISHYRPIGKLTSMVIPVSIVTNLIVKQLETKTSVIVKCFQVRYT